MMHFLQWTGWDSLRFAPLAMLALAVIVVVLGMALAWLVAQRPVVAVAEPSVRWFGGAAVPAPAGSSLASVLNVAKAALNATP